MRTEKLGSNQNPLNEATITHAYLGAWEPAPAILPEPLKPHVRDIGGVPSVPIRLVNLVGNALSSPTTKTKL